MSYTIRVRREDGHTFTAKLKPKVTTLGRHQDNDIVLDDDEKTSRRHARIEVDGDKIWAIDLKSSNGTHLNNAELLPGVRQPWSTKTELRIGRHRLQLLPDDGSANEIKEPPPTVVGMDSHSEDAANSVSAERRDSVALSLSPEVIQGSFGNLVDIRVEAANQGNRVENLRIAVDGIPQEWVLNSPEFNLHPDTQESGRLSLLPKGGLGTRNGDYMVVVELISRDGLSSTVKNVNLHLSGAPEAGQFGLSVHPPRREGSRGGTYQVHVNNYGQFELTLKLGASDVDNKCRYAIEPEQITLPPGNEERVKLQIKAKRPLPGTKAFTHAFTVEASPEHAAEFVRTAHGEWVQTPPEFEVQLLPETPRGTTRGLFQLVVSNRSFSKQVLQLEPEVPDDLLRAECEERQLTLEAGDERSVRVAVQLVRAMVGNEEVDVPFGIRVYPQRAKQLGKSGNAVWTRVPPTFSIALSPPSRRGAALEKFLLSVQNQSPGSFTAVPTIEMAHEGCCHKITPKEARIRAGDAQYFQLSIEPNSKRLKGGIAAFPFTILVQAAENPEEPESVEGLYEQSRHWGGCMQILVGGLVLIGLGFLFFG